MTTENRISKIVLGTVQFGCQYGINSAGRPGRDEVSAILSRAAEAGITILDTSSAYGDAEEVLGGCMGKRLRGASPCPDFRLVSKYPDCGLPVDTVFRKSLERLGLPCLYGYMLHHFAVYRRDNSVWEEFRRLRDEGLVSRIGFSLYDPEELELLLDRNIDFDILQFPRNLFDRRFDYLLPELARRSVEVHVRSTFLQGLFFKDRDSLPQKLLPLRENLLELDEFAQRSGSDASSLALAFNLLNDKISGVLIGVDNVSQLDADIACAAYGGPLPDIKVSNQALLNPVNWK